MGGPDRHRFETFSILPAGLVLEFGALFDEPEAARKARAKPAAKKRA